jgi:hypothetical protein
VGITIDNQPPTIPWYRKIKWGKVWAAVIYVLGVGIPYAMQGNPSGISIGGHLIPWEILLAVLGMLGVHIARDPIPDSKMNGPLKFLRTGDGTALDQNTKKEG